MSHDPVDLTTTLVACPSVTPDEGGALVALGHILRAAGFECWRVDVNDTCNLYARWGKKGAARSFGFNGHTDVVPPGDVAAWTYPPFSACIDGDWLYGRGATDMKSGVAAFVAAACDFVQDTPPDGAIIITITGDEEGPALDGTIAILDWMDAQGERMTDCLVGEPTSTAKIGDQIKIGRRGSMTAWFTVQGKQGHSAYLDKAHNPVPAAALLAHLLSTWDLDDGTDHFDASTVAVTSIDTHNTATNVVPGKAHVAVNIRFNDTHTGAGLSDAIAQIVNKVTAQTGSPIETEIKISGEAFLTKPGPFVDLIQTAVADETGQTPRLSTSGGTSDARFVKNHCPVVEFGLVGHRMHQIDERAYIPDIHDLKRIYKRILTDYFTL
jgi:succinyl-diaminopimelate desuccinylase